MKLTIIFGALLFLTTFVLGAPIPAPAKKGPNPIKAAAAAKNAPPPPPVTPPAVGQLVKVQPPPTTNVKGKAVTVAKHPAVVIGPPDANGNVPIAQLSHSTTTFTNFAQASDVIPTLSSQPGFDNRGSGSTSFINLTPGQAAQVSAIDQTAFPSTLTASSDELNTITSTIQNVVATKPAAGEVTDIAGKTVAADASTAATDAASDASSSSDGIVSDAENAVKGAASDAEGAVTGVVSDAESAAKGGLSGLVSDAATGAEDVVKDGALGDLADVAEHLR